MAWTTLAAIYFVMWWVVLFAILPWGVRSQAEHGEIAPGTDPGAPVLPHLRQKVFWTTVVTTLVFGVLYYGYVQRWLTLEAIAKFVGLPF